MAVLAPDMIRAKPADALNFFFVNVLTITKISPCLKKEDHGGDLWLKDKQIPCGPDDDNYKKNQKSTSW